MFEHGVELVIKVTPPYALTATASPSGVSCLHHELLYHTVENVAIVVAITCMNTEVFNGLWATEETDRTLIKL